MASGFRRLFRKLHGAVHGDGALLEAQLHAVGRFDQHGLVAHVNHLAVQPTDGDDLGSSLQRFPELLRVLGLLLLWAEHGEVDDNEDKAHHGHELPGTSLAGRCGLEQNGMHGHLSSV